MTTDPLEQFRITNKISGKGQLAAVLYMQPFMLKYSIDISLGAIIRDLLDQAQKRQHEAPGTMYVGTVLQHLVGAKLEIVLKERSRILVQHGASVADTVSAREGDFVIDTVVIHVTTAPTQMLMQKCRQNLEHGCHPIIITIHDMVAAAQVNARIERIEDRVDILAADQFLATNLYELSGFQDAQRRTTIEELLSAYNTIVEEHETDPSLRIEFSR